MARTLSTMLELGTRAPDFNLPDTNGNQVSLQDFGNAKGLLLVFMCNHCPYVKHIQHKLAEVADTYMQKGIAVVGISSNDADNYPDDSHAKMKEEAEKAGYNFPYLYDEDQSVAKAYQAACTPDFFLFDASLNLYYRGQFDSSRPSNGVTVTGEDLVAAMDALLSGEALTTEQKPSMGCNIKWKAGNEPDYYAA